MSEIYEKFGRLLLRANIIDPHYFILSVIFLSLLAGWKIMLVFMTLIIIHENGHAHEGVRQGLDFFGISIYPFGGIAHLGGITSRDRMIPIALMGPIWGLAPAAVFLVLYYLTQIPDFAAASGAVATLNLLNLLPITALDGGKVTKALTGRPKEVFWAGIVLLVILTFYDPRIIIIAVVAAVLGYKELQFDTEYRMYSDPMLERDVIKGFMAYLIVAGLFLLILALAGGLNDPFFWSGVL